MLYDYVLLKSKVDAYFFLFCFALFSVNFKPGLYCVLMMLSSMLFYIHFHFPGVLSSGLCNMYF